MIIQGEKRTIASLYPLQTELIVRDYVPLGKPGGISFFQMKACAKGDPPVLLVIDDCWQIHRSPEDPAEEDHKTVDVKFIAKDLVLDHWRKPLLGAPNDCGHLGSGRLRRCANVSPD